MLASACFVYLVFPEKQTDISGSFGLVRLGVRVPRLCVFYVQNKVFAGQLALVSLRPRASGRSRWNSEILRFSENHAVYCRHAEAGKTRSDMKDTTRHARHSHNAGWRAGILPGAAGLTGLACDWGVMPGGKKVPQSFARGPVAFLQLK